LSRADAEMVKMIWTQAIAKGVISATACRFCRISLTANRNRPGGDVVVLRWCQVRRNVVADGKALARRVSRTSAR